MSEPIEIKAEVVNEQPKQTQAVAIRETGGAIGRAMSIDELKENLNFIREVMANVMKENQDYGKIPGCGDKPGLFQPGAQKLLMTFRLCDEVANEKVTDLPNFHREYAFVVRLRSDTGKTWEGVGTCSTLESKYRYRKAERRCPKCGQNTIIKGKAEYGGGWICFAKKGGCGAKYGDNDTAITSQAGGQVENENPADHWNTARKMAFKRALVHAAINATNTSELWSQDLEDLRDNGVVGGEPPPPSQNAPQSTRAANPPVTGTPPPGRNVPPKAQESAPARTETPFATAESKAKMIGTLQAGPGQPGRDTVTEYFRKIDQLMPNEEVEDLMLTYVPATSGQMRHLCNAIGEFANGQPAKRAFEPNHEPKAAKAKKPIEVPRDAEPLSDDPNSPDAKWRVFPMPFGKNAGVVLEDLEKNYLFGLWANFEVETEYNGKPKKAETIAKDTEFRVMLDAAGEHYQFKKKD